MVENPRKVRQAVDYCFSDGTLQIRARRTGKLVRVRNTGPGDAILFRLTPHLEHRVTGVMGNHPRTAFAGWFHAVKDA